MKVSELRRMLRDAKPDDEVFAWDADAEAYMPVTGMVYGSGDARVGLQTDGND